MFLKYKMKRKKKYKKKLKMIKTKKKIIKKKNKKKKKVRINRFYKIHSIKKYLIKQRINIYIFITDFFVILMIYV